MKRVALYCLLLCGCSEVYDTKSFSCEGQITLQWFPKEGGIESHSQLARLSLRVKNHFGARSVSMHGDAEFGGDYRVCAFEDQMLRFVRKLHECDDANADAGVMNGITRSLTLSAGPMASPQIHYSGELQCSAESPSL